MSDDEENLQPIEELAIEPFEEDVQDDDLQELDLQTRLDDLVDEIFRGAIPGIVTTWILVAHVTSTDDEGEWISSYPLLMRQGAQPTHTVRGLLDEAEDQIRGVGKWSVVIREETDDD